MPVPQPREQVQYGFLVAGGELPSKPKRTCFLLVLLLAAVGAHAQAPTPPKAPQPVRHVILISIDGLMPFAYLSPDEHGLKVPTLRELARNGAWSDGALSVFPSVTYPAHTSIVTGANPGRHGIVTNDAWDPLDENDDGQRWYAADIRATTLWEAARARGLRTALVYWPVTVGARATAIVPEYWRAGTAEDVKLLDALSTPDLLGAVRKRFPTFAAGFMPPRVMDESLADIAVHMIETARPHLMLLHMFEVDREQHYGGAFSRQAFDAIENADRQIARVIAAAKKAGIWQQTVLVVVSDHGFLPAPKRVRPGVLLREKGLITLDERNRIKDWKASVVTNGAQAYVYVRDPADQETRKALLEIFEARTGKPDGALGRMYRQEEIRSKGGDPEAFLALEAAPGFAMSSGYYGDYTPSSPTLATHGHDPERPEMRSSLLVYGRAIVPGPIRQARLIDVAPTVAKWLNLSLPQAEGRPLPVAVRPAAAKPSVLPKAQK
jgi:predicted AlkP superfamily pyrophosphatase or phosphodiesterase